MKLRHRHRLRRKEVAQLSDEIEKSLGISPFLEDQPLDRAHLPDFDVLIFKNTVVGMVFGDVPFLSIRGILQFNPAKSFVEVDMGAVPYVTNGADVMAPGVTTADLALKKDGYAWVRDQNNKKPLAIVQMLRPAEDIMVNPAGKAARNLHFVGDKLWCMEL